jgi:predicted RNA binding protein YcfA (HicA-like mRNA interferase family)
MKVKELIKLLEADGWSQVRMSGSYRQFHHPKRGTVILSGQPSRGIPPGTLNNVSLQGRRVRQKAERNKSLAHKGV